MGNFIKVLGMFCIQVFRRSEIYDRTSKLSNREKELIKR